MWALEEELAEVPPWRETMAYLNKYTQMAIQLVKDLAGRSACGKYQLFVISLLFLWKFRFYKFVTTMSNRVLLSM